MKAKQLLATALTAIALTSCQNIDTDLSQPTTQQAPSKHFTFTVKGQFEMHPLDEITRAASNMTADGVEMTDLWVLDVVDGNIQQTIHQVPTDEDWGKPQMQLTLGHHHVLFLASRGTGATYADGTVTWTKPNDTFYKDYEVEVVSTSNGNRAVTLDRIATRLKLTIDDPLQPQTTTLAMTPQQWYTGWNLLTSTPIATDTYTVQWDIPSTYWNMQGISVTMWGLSTTTEWTTDVTFTSKAGTTTNAQANLPDVPLQANRTTAYHGRLYSAQDASTITLTSQWQPDYEGVY